jgi:GT2 family glycosyltransferase
MLVRREVFERVGLLDEAFYLYFEEADWCLRVRRSGYRILAVPSSLAWHRVSATLGPTSPVIDYYMLRNHLRFIACHWSGMARLLFLGRTIGRNLLTIAAYTLKPQQGQRLSHRNARLLALRDAALGRWGRMGLDVEAVCQSASP